MCFQKFFCVLQILRSVDAYGFHRGHSHLDGKTIFKPSELLKTFSHLKRRLWNGGDALEHISLVGIHAEVGVELMTRWPFLLFVIAHIRNHRAREILSVPVGIYHHFWRIGVFQL